MVEGLSCTQRVRGTKYSLRESDRLLNDQNVVQTIDRHLIDNNAVRFARDYEACRSVMFAPE